MSITSIRIAAALEQPLQELSNKLDRSKSYLVNQAIKSIGQTGTGRLKMAGYIAGA